VKSQKGQVFEQGFLTEAFQYSMEDKVEECDKMLRALRGLLVQKKVEKRFKDRIDGISKQLDGIELRPIPSVEADIYRVCSLLRAGTDELVLWDGGKPFRTMKRRELQAEMRTAMNELNKIAGELSDILEIAPLDLGKKKFGWLQKQQEVSRGGKG